MFKSGQHDEPATRTQPRFRRGLTALALSCVAATGGVLAATAAPAAAATDYGVNMTQACRYTYGSYNYIAWYGSITNPFSWMCAEVNYPSRIAGGVDVQKYCSITYPGSRAVVAYWNAWGWRCRR